MHRHLTHPHLRFTTQSSPLFPRQRTHSTQTPLLFTTPSQELNKHNKKLTNKHINIKRTTYNTSKRKLHSTCTYIYIYASLILDFCRLTNKYRRAFVFSFSLSCLREGEVCCSGFRSFLKPLSYLWARWKTESKKHKRRNKTQLQPRWERTGTHRYIKPKKTKRNQTKNNVFKSIVANYISPHRPCFYRSLSFSFSVSLHLSILLVCWGVLTTPAAKLG